MRLLTVEHIPPARRRNVPIWYPAVMLSLSGEALRRTQLDFETARDDLDTVTFAYAEVEDIPIMLMRHESEPAHIYTLMVDAASEAKNRGWGVLSFASGVLASLHLGSKEVIWRNDELDRLFPAKLSVKSAKSAFEQLDLNHIEPVSLDDAGTSFEHTYAATAKIRL
jgi:hypothetical protein